MTSYLYNNDSNDNLYNLALYQPACYPLCVATLRLPSTSCSCRAELSSDLTASQRSISSSSSLFRTCHRHSRTRRAQLQPYDNTIAINPLSCGSNRVAHARSCKPYLNVNHQRSQLKRTPCQNMGRIRGCLDDSDPRPMLLPQLKIRDRLHCRLSKATIVLLCYQTNTLLVFWTIQQKEPLHLNLDRRKP